MNINNKKNKKSSKSGGLVITRREGKTVKIGDDIYVTLLSHNEHSGARLRVQAPSNVKISRLDQID